MMGPHSKTAAGLLLLVQSFHLASFQHSTSSPAITIDRNWLRELVRNASLNRTLAENGLDYDERGQPRAESGGGVPSGAMAILSAEDESLPGEGSGQAGDMFTSMPVDLMFTPSQPPDGNMSSISNVSDGASESAQGNTTQTAGVPDGRTTTPQIDPNVTGAEDLAGNRSDSATASPPQVNATAAKDWNSTDAPDSTAPDIPEATTVGSAMTVDQTDTTAATPTTSLQASTAVVVNAPEGGNKTGKEAAESSSSDRGMTGTTLHVIRFWVTFNSAITPQKSPLKPYYYYSLLFCLPPLTHIYRLSFSPLPLLEDRRPFFEKGKVG